MTTKQLHELRRASAVGTGNRVAAAFKIVGCSQMDCARQTGFTPQYITDVKNGRRNPSLDNSHRWAAFFGCSIEDLFPAPSREAVA